LLHQLLHYTFVNSFTCAQYLPDSNMDTGTGGPCSPLEGCTCFYSSQ